MLGGIPLLSQKNFDDICLKVAEFDFYAQAVVDRKQLRKDTNTFRRIIEAQITIINAKNDQLKGDSIIIESKDEIAKKFKIAFQNEEKSRIKQEKKLKLFKNLSLILGSTAVVLAGVLALTL